MAISAISGAAQQGTVQAGSASTLSQGSDYMTFLTMLTVQMRNQDPLNPMQASDFAVQLATFAGVEQQSRTNDLLATLVGRGDLASMGGMVGMEVQVPGTGWFEGQPLDLAPDPIAGADRVQLTVRDAVGAIVATRDIPPGTIAYQWDGRTNQGEEAAHGRYSFEIESWAGGELLETSASGVFMRVREVRRDGSSLYLVLPGDLVVESSQIAGLRAPVAGVVSVPPESVDAPLSAPAASPVRRSRAWMDPSQR